MSEKIAITRRSKVGFGYNAGASQVWNKSQTESRLEVDPTETPTHIGTFATVSKAIADDRTLRSFQGGTFYTTAWFVKVDGQWRKIKNTDENMWNINRLTEKTQNMFGEMKYESDVVTVEIE